MKHTITRLLTMIFSCALVVAMLVPMAGAVARASYYFSATEIVATATGNGKVVVEFDINATHTMKEVGATEIIIWEKQSNGSYDEVKSYTSGLIDTNTAFSYRRVTYYGTPGTKYYATVVCYAKDSNGSEKLYCDTNVVTA